MYIPMVPRKWRNEAGFYLKTKQFNCDSLDLQYFFDRGIYRFVFLIFFVGGIITTLECYTENNGLFNMFNKIKYYMEITAINGMP